MYFFSSKAKKKLIWTNLIDFETHFLMYHCIDGFRESQIQLPTLDVWENVLMISTQSGVAFCLFWGRVWQMILNFYFVL